MADAQPGRRAAGSVVTDEINRFDALATQWWDPAGPMRPLHAMNPLRVGWIDARIRARFGGSVHLLDLGCGAGLAAEALAEAITALGGTPVNAANVSFTAPAALVAKPTITNVLRFAASAERSAGVSYNKAVTALEAAKHRFLASAIEGVATQHFIVIAALVLGLAQPGPSLASAGAPGRLVPRAFVSSTGTAATRAGLDVAPPANYWA